MSAALPADRRRLSAVLDAVADVLRMPRALVFGGGRRGRQLDARRLYYGVAIDRGLGHSEVAGFVGRHRTTPYRPHERHRALLASVPVYRDLVARVDRAVDVLLSDPGLD